MRLKNLLCFLMFLVLSHDSTRSVHLYASTLSTPRSLPWGGFSVKAISKHLKGCIRGIRIKQLLNELESANTDEATKLTILSELLDMLESENEPLITKIRERTVIISEKVDHYPAIRNLLLMNWDWWNRENGLNPTWFLGEIIETRRIKRLYNAIWFDWLEDELLTPEEKMDILDQLVEFGPRAIPILERHQEAVAKVAIPLLERMNETLPKLVQLRTCLVLGSQL